MADHLRFEKFQLALVLGEYAADVLRTMWWILTNALDA